MPPSWNLGIGNVSEEINALLNKLSSEEEGQNAAQQDRLVGQAAEIQKLDKALHETIFKPQPLSSIPASMSLSALEPPTDVITYIERLLNTVDRLRGERDSLRRDVEFLESESRFTIEALEAKLSASISCASDKTVTTITQENVQEELNNHYSTLQSHPLSNTDNEATRNLRGQIEELENRVMRRTEQIGIHQHDIKRLETNLRLQEERLSEMTTELETMVTQKDAMVEDCAAAREARDEALIRVERLEEELESSEGRNVKRLETNLCLQEERLSEMTTELEMMASQKDALVEDCAAAREARDEALIRVERLEEELESSDGRNVDNTVVVESLIATIAQTVCQARETIRLSREEYTSSQNAHQRTIQEANSLNLELEQRLGAATEKLAELELLRERYDSLKKEHFNQESRLQEELTSISQSYQDLERSRDALQDDKVRLTEDLNRIQKDHATQIDRCREENRAIEQELEQQIASLHGQIEEQQIGAATENLAELELLREQYDDLKKEHFNQESRLQEELTSISQSYQDLERSRDSLQDDKVRLTEDLTRIQKEHATQIDRCREENRAIEQELEQQITSLQGRIEEQQLGAATEKSAELELLREQYDDLKKEHAKQESRLQEELTSISQSYQDLERSRDSLQDDKVRLTEDITRIQKEHATQIDRCREENRAIEQALEQQIASLHGQIEEQQLGAATEKSEELEQLREQYDDLKKEHFNRESRLQEELTSLSQSYQDLERSRDALQDDKVRLTEELTRIQEEHATQIGRCREENRAIEQELEQQIASLQGQIEEQGRLLGISEREVSRIRDRLQEEVEGRAQDKNQHAMALLSETQHNEDADRTISQLRGELETVERNLQQTNVHLQTIEDEKLTMRQQTTELEAEVQRSKSLIHYLEIQMKDSDQLVSTLKGDIERTKANLAHSEKSWKTAEVNLSLQNAQRKREMTELERELSAFRSMPNLEQALAELDERNVRNSEMEELLRKKCVEIEENDDRALEMLKEKKKLTTKVESLTRKVQNLQAKLATARTSSAAQPSESQPTLPASLPLISSTPQSTISSRPRSVTVPSAPPLYPPPIETPSTSTTQNPSNRVVSGPSLLPRPKTPERRTVTPVFKARTPERQMQPEIALIPPATVIGKKRAAPDDFGAYGKLPAQAFTADGEDVENRTPRERKVPNSLQSGSRPIAPSPRRGAPSPRTSPFISDLTNSPQHLARMMNPSSERPSKRGWLGKIRGNSHATDRPQVPSMRPLSLFDSGDRS